jgi:pimeloyl-ACP methyl ester carboxylesterase
MNKLPLVLFIRLLFTPKGRLKPEQKVKKIMRHSVIGSLLFLSLLFGGCRPLPSVTSPLVSKATPIPLTLKPCIVADKTVYAECGALHVPEDRTHPEGRYLDLDVVVVRARGPGHEPDPLFYITGGPGGAATDSDIVSGVKTFLWEINAQRDIVFLDQRGTNGKHRLTCESPSSLNSDSSQQQVDAWIKQCLANLDGDPRFYTTAVAMRDLDDARAALGYDKINLYGGSYGVIAEQVYMRMFPEHIRTVVMDHGTALDLPFRYILPRASQSALDQILAYCEQDEKCHAAYPDIRGDWKKILDRLAKGPVVTSWIPPGAHMPDTVTMEGLAEGIHQLMFKAGTYVQIPSLIHTLAINENWTSIVKSYNEQYGSSGGDNRLLLMKEVIFCFEPAWGVQPDQVARFSPDSYYLSQQVKILQSEPKLCAALPKPDPSLIYGPGKPTPLSALMFNSLIDPQNPPSNIEPALKEFTRSRLVVEPTEGHQTNFSVDSNCRWKIIAQYIEQGSVDGLDISCLEKIKPSFTIEDE